MNQAQKSEPILDLPATAATESAAKQRERLLQTLQFSLLALALVVMPFLVYPVFLMKVICFAVFTSSVNLLLGQGGLLSFGHAAFFGLAAYTTGYLASHLGVSVELAFLGGVAASIVLGAVFGAVAVRRLGIYFAMITLALAQIVYFLAVQNPAITRGEDGLQPIPLRALFGIIDLNDTMTLYTLCAVILIVTLMFVHRVTTSPFGKVLRAIRDNEERARTLGYSPRRYKLLAFVITSGIAGVAGSLKALVMQVVTLGDLHLTTSAEPILMMLVGGIGSLFGPVLGAAVIISAEHFLAPFGAWVTVLKGVIFIACVLLFKQGITGLAHKWFARTK
ncbi:branched-chain amino acid ABC transporter permease [Pontitalea aquivivens]|uniref:branched-chain amino acid ABC transporter permease n=1 Tax=Pontitalea aquivivens TaxID=3388663 RepID=UPI003970538A